MQFDELGLPEVDPDQQTQVFRDLKDQPWYVEIELPDIRRVKQATGIDLTRFLAKDFQHRDCFTNSEKCVDILWALLEPKLLQMGMDVREFVSRLNRDVLDQASGCIIAGLIQFYPFGSRPLMQRALVWILSGSPGMSGKSCGAA